MYLKCDESGFTLVELLIAVVITGVIAVPLGNGIIGFLRNTDDTQRRLSESHDAQISAAYFAQDVASIGVRDWATHPFPLKQSIELNAPSAGGLYPCGPAGTPPAIIRFAWDDPTSADALPQTAQVSYVIKTVGTQRRLHRIWCAGGTSTDTIMAHNVAPTLPVVACSTSCVGAPDVPQTVTLTLTIQEPSSTDPPYAITLTGQRRQT